MEKKLNKIKVIVPFYNAAQYITNCAQSILQQDYDNFEVVFIDDASTDGSFDNLPKCSYKKNEDGTIKIGDDGKPEIDSCDAIFEITKCLNVITIQSPERRTALPNIHFAIMQYCNDLEDIVVLIDGDDAISKGTLSYVNDLYNENKNWVHYGSSKWSNGMRPCDSEYTKEEYQNVRKAPFRVSHLRSFRFGAYLQIPKQDPDLKCYKWDDGKWFTHSYDTAMFFALLDITPFDKLKRSDKILYYYNRENILNEDKNGGQSIQTAVHIECSNRPPFKQVLDYHTGELA
jgi:glycosyltransferase involved in cell wall biosynthesis